MSNTIIEHTIPANILPPDKVEYKNSTSGYVLPSLLLSEYSVNSQFQYAKNKNDRNAIKNAFTPNRIRILSPIDLITSIAK